MKYKGYTIDNKYQAGKYKRTITKPDKSVLEPTVKCDQYWENRTMVAWIDAGCPGDGKFVKILTIAYEDVKDHDKVTKYSEKFEPALEAAMTLNGFKRENDGKVSYRTEKTIRFSKEGVRIICSLGYTDGNYNASVEFHFSASVKLRTEKGGMAHERYYDKANIRNFQTCDISEIPTRLNLLMSDFNNIKPAAKVDVAAKREESMIKNVITDDLIKKHTKKVYKVGSGRHGWIARGINATGAPLHLNLKTDLRKSDLHVDLSVWTYPQRSNGRTHIGGEFDKGKTTEEFLLSDPKCFEDATEFVDTKIKQFFKHSIDVGTRHVNDVSNLMNKIKEKQKEMEK